MGPHQELQGKRSYCFNLFITVKWSLPLAFPLASVSASSSGAVTKQIEIMTKKNVKIFDKTTPSTVVKRTILL